MLEIELKHPPVLTCKKGHEQSDPAQNVGPGETPVAETLPEEVDRHPGVDGHSEQNKERWRRHKEKLR